MPSRCLRAASIVASQCRRDTVKGSLNSTYRDEEVHKARCYSDHISVAHAQVLQRDQEHIHELKTEGTILGACKVLANVLGAIDLFSLRVLKHGSHILGNPFFFSVVKRSSS